MLLGINGVKFEVMDQILVRFSLFSDVGGKMEHRCTVHHLHMDSKKH